MEQEFFRMEAISRTPITLQSDPGEKQSKKLSYDRHDFLLAGLISFIHILTAIIYAKFFGITIRIHEPWSTWDWFWQTLPLDALRTDLLESLWYLHAQPPIFNLLGGVLAKLFFPFHLEALHILYVTLGGLLSGLIYLLAANFTSRRLIGFLWAFILSQNLSLFLYEAYILYSLLTAFLVILNLSCILWHSRTKTPIALYCFIITLNILVLTRSSYHLLLLPAALVFIWLISTPEAKKRTLIISSLLCLISIFWYAKNYEIFGVFGTSSWFGQSLWKIASSSYSDEELQDLAKEGVIDQMVVERRNFLRPAAYETYGFTKRSSIPALSNNDYNNINIIDISHAYGENAIRLIRYSPWIYLKSILAAFLFYCLPSTSYNHLAINFSKIIPLKGAYLQALQIPETAVTFILLPSTLALYLAQKLKLAGQHRLGIQQLFQQDSVLMWCFFMIGYSVVTSCMLEINENMRFKFDVEQLIWLFIPIVLSRVKSLARKISPQKTM